MTRAEYLKAYYAKNKIKILEQRKTPKIREYKKSYYRKKKVLFKKYYAESRKKFLALPKKEQEKALKLKREYGRKHARKLKALNPFVALARCAKKTAKKRKIPYNLDRSWVDARYTGHCELTGIAFKSTPCKSSPFSPSLDRVNNKKGYTKDNTRFVLMGVNFLKHIGTDEDMYKIAAELIKNRLKRIHNV